jgi:MFS family permease
LADRLGRRWPSAAGLLLVTIGLLPLAVSSGDLPAAGLLAALGLAGAGIGLSQAGLQTAAVEAVERSEAGVAAGVFSTSRYAGSIVASGLLAALLGSEPSGGAGMATFLVVLVAAAALSAAASLGLAPQASTATPAPHQEALLPATS